MLKILNKIHAYVVINIDIEFIIKVKHNITNMKVL